MMHDPQERAERKAAESTRQVVMRLRQIEDLRAILRLQEGRRFVHAICDQSFYFDRTTMAGNSAQMTLNEGMRQVAMLIARMGREDDDECWELWKLMQDEARTARKQVRLEAAHE